MMISPVIVVLFESLVRFTHRSKEHIYSKRKLVAVRKHRGMRCNRELFGFKACENRLKKEKGGCVRRWDDGEREKVKWD
jgi:hypothetical protein